MVAPCPGTGHGAPRYSWVEEDSSAECVENFVIEFGGVFDDGDVIVP